MHGSRPSGGICVSLLGGSRVITPGPLQKTAEVRDGREGGLERARAFHAQGRLAEAEALYREVLRVQPDEVGSAGRARGLVTSSGTPGRSRGPLCAGLAIVPDSARLHANLGEVFAFFGRPDEAAGEMQRALALDPGSAQSWNVLGHLAHDRKRHDDAVAAYREAIRLSPRFVPGHINLGIALLALHQPPRPPRRCAALRIEPDNLLALTKLGQALWELRDPDLVDEAETHCRRALSRGTAASRGTREPRPGASPPGAVPRGARLLRAGVGAGPCAALRSGSQWASCSWDAGVTMTRYGP